MPINETVDSYIEKVAGELEVDAVGLWQIVAIGKSHFNLGGNDLKNFVRRSLRTLLARDARPVVFASDEHHIWELVDRYGKSSEEIIEAVMLEWDTSGREPDAGSVWFATKSIYDQINE